MRYVIHVFILLGSLIAGSVALSSALKGESGWYGVIIAGIVFGFAAANLTLLEIRNWVRTTGHRQHSRLLRLLAAPVAQLSEPHDERNLEHDSNQDERISGQQQPRLPSHEKSD